MTVYIVTSVCDYEYGCAENVGAFPTREQAEQYIEDCGGQSTWTHWSDRVCNQYHIEEWEIEE